MSRLSAHTLDQAKVSGPAYDREALGIGIVHFGPGAFTRAHQAVFTDDAIARSGGDWGICAVSLNSARAKTSLGPQDGLYTLAIRDQVPSFRIIGAIKQVLFAGEDAVEILATLCVVTTSFITLTITEKGYALDGSGKLDPDNPMIAADIANPDRPTSAIGYIVQATARRRQRGLNPLTVMSCDNLPSNGDRLRVACADLATLMGQDGLSKYIREAMRFPNTMVDSITPATDDGVLEAVENAVGLRDEAAVQREAFAQWVIEDTLPADRPDWASAGAIITPDVHGYENTKLGILNGAHSTLTYLGLLAGHASVGEAVADPVLRKFADQLIRQETIPSINAPEGLSLTGYWEATLARFDNPHIVHKLEQISHDGSQKIPARILPVILYHGESAQRACFVVAAWIEWTRQRRRTDHLPTDGWLSANASSLPDPDLSATAFAHEMLTLKAIFPANLRHDLITNFADTISTHGVLNAISKI